MPQHPIWHMLAQGLLVNINSDDPAYFGGDVNDNFMACLNALNLSAQDIVQLAKNSFKSSWLDQAQKKPYLHCIDSIFQKC